MKKVNLNVLFKTIIWPYVKTLALAYVQQQLDSITDTAVSSYREKLRYKLSKDTDIPGTLRKWIVADGGLLDQVASTESVQSYKDAVIKYLANL